MWEKTKAFFWWLWKWITVIGAVVVGGAASVAPYLDTLSAIDMASILPAALAVKIVAGIGLVKWFCVACAAIHAWLTAEKPKPEYSFDQLVAGITPENRYPEVKIGPSK